MGFRGGEPRRSWPGLLQPECDKTEQCGLRTAGCQCNTDAACRLNNAASDLQEMETDAAELALPQGMPARNMIAHIEQQPVSGSVKDEAELVGERRSEAVCAPE